MTIMQQRIKRIKEINRLYRDHSDSLKFYSETTGAEINLADVDTARKEEVSRIIEDTTI